MLVLTVLHYLGSLKGNLFAGLVLAVTVIPNFSTIWHVAQRFARRPARCLSRAAADRFHAATGRSEGTKPGTDENWEPDDR